MAEHIEEVKTYHKTTDIMDISCDSRTLIVHEFYYLLEQGVTKPSELDIIIERLASVINSLDCNSDLVKFTLEFYKNLHPIPTETLLIQLFAQGVITDESILRKSCFGPFLSQLLFQSVTESSVECAEYCTKLWIDRISDENCKPKTVPNPLEYLNPNSPTQPSAIPYSILLQFKLLDDKQRKLVILDLRKMANLIPPTFYPRLILAFMIILEFYKKEDKSQGSVQETCLWAETWYNLILISLAKPVQRKEEKHLQLHHVLNGTVVSTKAFEFIAFIPDVLSNVLISLELFAENSSSFTKKWVLSLRSELECSQK